MNGSEITLALIAIVGSVITALFKLLNDNTKVQRELVEETRKGNREAAERNGHLGEQNIQITELISQMNTEVKAAAQRNYDAITNVNEQHVKKQIVQHETVKSKD